MNNNCYNSQVFEELQKDFKSKFNIEVELKYLGVPHEPSKLEDNQMGVYIFFKDNKCLKIGKAGLNSKARWNSHHYNPKSSDSNLAKSLLNDSETLLEENIGDYIRKNICRVEFTINDNVPEHTLNLLEAYLLFKLNPKFELNKY